MTRSRWWSTSRNIGRESASDGVWRKTGLGGKIPRHRAKVSALRRTGLAAVHCSSAAFFVRGHDHGSIGRRPLQGRRGKRLVLLRVPIPSICTFFPRPVDRSVACRYRRDRRSRPIRLSRLRMQTAQRDGRGRREAVASTRLRRRRRHDALHHGEVRRRSAGWLHDGLRHGRRPEFRILAHQGHDDGGATRPRPARRASGGPSHRHHSAFRHRA